MPRLEPIEKPNGFVMRMAYWGIRRQFGKVITPVKVVIARMPKALQLTNEISKFELNGIRLDPSLHFMIGILASQINGCDFCTDLGRAIAVKERLGLEKFDAIPEYRTSPLFSDRERAALAYVEEATRNKKVSDGTFENLRKHYADWEIAEITWINAVENYYNLLTIPLQIGSDGLCAVAQARQKTS